VKHSIRVDGEAFRLRPISTDDAAFIIKLRTDPELGKYLHATSSSVADQIAWTHRYYERQGDWYFIVEQVSNGESHGAVAIYNYEAANASAEWGRWILKRGSLAALESVSLVYDAGFDRLGLTLMYSRTEDANQPVVSFHTSLGSALYGRVMGSGGERWTEQRITSVRWREIRPTLEKKISAVAAVVNR
jgi:RimJ/RimL family protein N-acetyltransferase